MTMPNVPETPQTADAGTTRREGFNLSAVALRYRQVTLFFLLIWHRRCAGLLQPGPA